MPLCKIAGGKQGKAILVQNFENVNSSINDNMSSAETKEEKLNELKKDIMLGVQDVSHKEEDFDANLKEGTNETANESSKEPKSIATFKASSLSSQILEQAECDEPEQQGKNIVECEIDYCEVKGSDEDEEEEVQYIDEEAEEEQQLPESTGEEKTALNQPQTFSTEMIDLPSLSGNKETQNGSINKEPNLLELDSNKFEEISEGSIDQAEQDDVINELSSEQLITAVPCASPKNIHTSLQLEKHIPFSEAESLEEVFFATENDNIKYIAEDKDNDDISNNSFSDHGATNLSLEEISDDDLEPAKKRKKSVGNGRNDVNKIELKESDLKNKVTGIFDENHKRPASVDGENTRLSKRLKVSEEKEESILKDAVIDRSIVMEKTETNTEGTSSEPQPKAESQAKNEETAYRNTPKKEDKSSSDISKARNISVSKFIAQVSKNDCQDNKDRKSSYRAHFETTNSSTQTETKVLKGKIVQCNISPIYSANLDEIKEDSQESSQLIKQHKHLLPSSIPDKIFTDVTLLAPALKAYQYTFSMGPVATADLDSLKFRDAVFRKVYKLNLTFDAHSQGIIQSTIKKYDSIATLIRKLKQLNFCNNHICMSITYNLGKNKGKEAWKAIMILKCRESAENLESVASGECHITKLYLKELPKDVSKDFISLLFPEALSIKSVLGFKEERVIILGFSDPKIAEEILQCCSLIIINGCQVKLTLEDLDEEPDVMIIDNVERSAPLKTTKNEALVFNKLVCDTSETGNSKLGHLCVNGNQLLETEESENVVETFTNDKDIVNKRRSAVNQAVSVTVENRKNSEGESTEKVINIASSVDENALDKSAISISMVNSIDSNEKAEVLIDDNDKIASQKVKFLNQHDKEIVKSQDQDFSITSNKSFKNKIPFREDAQLQDRKDEAVSKENCESGDSNDKTLGLDIAEVMESCDKTDINDDVEILDADEHFFEDLETDNDVDKSDDFEIVKNVENYKTTGTKVVEILSVQHRSSSQVDIVKDDDKCTSEMGNDTDQTINIDSDNVNSTENKEFDGEAKLSCAVNSTEEKETLAMVGGDSKNEQLEDVSDDEVLNQGKNTAGNSTNFTQGILDIVNIDLTKEPQELTGLSARNNDKQSAGSGKESKKLEMTDGTLQVSMEVIDVSEDEETEVVASKLQSSSNNATILKEGKMDDQNPLHYYMSWDKSSQELQDHRKYQQYHSQKETYNKARCREYPSRQSPMYYGQHSRDGFSNKRFPLSREGSPRHKVPYREVSAARRDSYYHVRSHSPSPRRESSRHKDPEVSRPSHYISDYNTGLVRQYSSGGHHSSTYDKWQTYYSDNRKPDIYSVPKMSTRARHKNWPSHSSTYPSESLWQGSCQETGKSKVLRDCAIAEKKYCKKRSRSQSYSDMSSTSEHYSPVRRKHSEKRSPKRFLKHTSHSPISISSRSHSLSPVSKSPSVGHVEHKMPEKDSLIDSVKRFIHISKDLKQSKRHLRSISPGSGSPMRSRSPVPLRAHHGQFSPSPLRYELPKGRKVSSLRTLSRSPTPHWQRDSRSPEYSRFKLSRHCRSPSPEVGKHDYKYKSHGYNDSKYKKYIERERQDYGRRSRNRSLSPIDPPPKSGQWSGQRDEGSGLNQWQPSYRSYPGKPASSSTQSSGFNPTYPPPNFPPSNYASQGLPTTYQGGGMYPYNNPCQYGYAGMGPSVSGPYMPTAGLPPMTQGYQQTFSMLHSVISSQPPSHSFGPSSSNNTSSSKKSWSLGNNATVFQRVLKSQEDTRSSKKRKKNTSGTIEKIEDRERQERPKQTKEVRVLTSVPVNK